MLDDPPEAGHSAKGGVFRPPPGARGVSRRADGELKWTLEVVRQLAVPPQASPDDVIAFVTRRIGRPVAVVPIEALVANGALEEGLGDALWIRVPVGVPGLYYRHLVCRGLVRALYREAGARHG